MSIQNTLLQTTTTALYTSSGASAVTTFLLCNTSNNPVVVSVFLVPNGSAASAQNTILSNLNIPAYETFVFDKEKFILDSGDAFYATSNLGNVVAATVSFLGL